MTCDGAEIFEIDPLTDSRWRTLVANHPRASIFHDPRWLKALELTYGYNPVAITSSPPGHDLSNGLVFCRVHSVLTGHRLVSLPFSDHCEPLVSGGDELATLLKGVRGIIDRKWAYFEIRPVSGVIDPHAGIGKVHQYWFHRLILRRDIEDLFHSFHKDCIQRKIHRAEREQLTYEEGNSQTLLGKFYRLLLLSRRRQCLPPQPLAWYQNLIQLFASDLKIRVASKDTVPVAAIITLFHPRSMVYKYAASNASYNRLGGNTLLLWRAIQEAVACGVEEVDLGRSDLDDDGLATFKERWGATRSELTYWRFPVVARPITTRWPKALAKCLVPVAPDTVLRALGTLLYKHAG